MRDKSQNHAFTRIKERYGVSLTGADLAAMCEQIKRGDCHVERHDRDGRLRVVVLYHKKAFFCVYSPRKNRIVTVLPRLWTDRRVKPRSHHDSHRTLRRAHA